MITSEPNFTFIHGTERARITSDWALQWNDHTLISPAEFETDFASTPRCVWPILPPFDRALRVGAVPHDQAYQHRYLLAVFNPARVYPRESMDLRRRFPEAMKKYVPVFVGESRAFFDAMFRDINLEANSGIVDTSKILSAYTVLRVTGGVAWEKYRLRGPAAYNKNSLNLPGL
jgi:hypothetical protein